MTRTSALSDLAVLRIEGGDAVEFLQAQLSSDVAALEAGHAGLTSWSTAGGKAIALPRLVRLDGDRILMILPAGLADEVVRRLSMYVFRSRVGIRRDTEARVFGLLDGVAMPPDDTGILVAAWFDRHLAIVPGDCSPLPEWAADADDDRTDWREAELRAGLPQVFPATTERFVPQMLNLDALGGISFQKGCYPGQEIIARAHYLGRIKRRMGLFELPGPDVPGPGEALPGVERSVVVDGLAGPERSLALSVLPVDTVALPAGVRRLPLPYELPEQAG